MTCNKCDYEPIEKWLDDDGNEYFPSHFCYDNMWYSATDDEWTPLGLDKEGSE